MNADLDGFAEQGLQSSVRALLDGSPAVYGLHIEGA